MGGKYESVGTREYGSAGVEMWQFGSFEKGLQLIILIYQTFDFY